MNIGKSIQDFVQYVTEAFLRIFGPSDDQYPEIGVQPFEEEPYQTKEADA